MIPDSQVLRILSEQFPEIEMDCAKAKLPNDFECLGAYAENLLKNEKFDDFKKFMEYVNHLYYHCGSKMKIGVDNVLLYKIGTYMDVCPGARAVRNILPQRMRAVISGQYGASAI